jgi:hypothetical protein
MIKAIRVTIGNSAWYLRATNKTILIDTAADLGIKFDTAEQTPLNPDNGIIHVWTLGKWAEAYPQHVHNQSK